MKLFKEILLVDDDLKTNKKTCEVIRSSGYAGNIKVTLNGGHALCYLEQMYSNVKTNFKLLILLDVSMPIMDGFEFLRKYNLDRMLNKNNIVIAMMGDKESETDMEKALNLGAIDFIYKPFSDFKLRHFLQNYFETLEIGIPKGAM